MKGVIYTISIYILCSLLGDVSGQCNFAGFYKELGCKPIPTNDNTTCPEEFECPDLHPDLNKCYYRGVSYDDRVKVPQNLIDNSCAVECRCSVVGGPEFDCAEVDCVETFDTDKQECIPTSDLDSCCSTGQVCGKDAIAAKKTCQRDGVTYIEGQYFEPQNSYKQCICTASWNGSLDDPTTCKDIDCGIEIYNQKNIAEKCAPVFVKNAMSCPFSFECPTNKTKIIKGINLRGRASQCFFGNMTINFGDEILVEDRCTKCSCEMPPFVTCIKTAYTCGE